MPYLSFHVKAKIWHLTALAVLWLNSGLCIAGAPEKQLEKLKTQQGIPIEFFETFDFKSRPPEFAAEVILTAHALYELKPSSGYLYLAALAGDTGSWIETKILLHIESMLNNRARTTVDTFMESAERMAKVSPEFCEQLSGIAALNKDGRFKMHLVRARIFETVLTFASRDKDLRLELINRNAYTLILKGLEQEKKLVTSAMDRLTTGRTLYHKNVLRRIESAISQYYDIFSPDSRRFESADLDKTDKVGSYTEPTANSVDEKYLREALFKEDIAVRNEALAQLLIRKKNLSRQTISALFRFLTTTDALAPKVEKEIYSILLGRLRYELSSRPDLEKIRSCWETLIGEADDPTS